MIKFIADEISAAHKINPIDRGILELKDAVKSLQTQVNGLQHKIDEFSQIPHTSLRGTVDNLIQMHAKSDRRSPPKAQGCGNELSSITETTRRTARETIRVLAYTRIYFHSRRGSSW